MTKRNKNPLLQIAKSGKISEVLNAYLDACKPPGEENKKENSSFPNLAGFCRWLGCGTKDAEKLKKDAPEAYDLLCAVLEDEALNSGLSPTVISAYLKARLGYGEKPSAEQKSADCGQMRLVFDHDILEDGS